MLSLPLLIILKQPSFAVPANAAIATPAACSSVGRASGCYTADAAAQRCALQGRGVRTNGVLNRHANKGLLDQETKTEDQTSLYETATGWHGHVALHHLHVAGQAHYPEPVFRQATGDGCSQRAPDPCNFVVRSADYSQQQESASSAAHCSRSTARGKSYR
jgi:hypothetical protein